MKLINNIKNYCSAALLLGAVATVTLTGCSEKIDESALYTFTGEMMIDHFENNPETFSSYLTLLNKVHPSKRSGSTMHDLLAARGNYTCFAPTNDAIQLYLDSLCNIGQLASNQLEQISDSVAEAIVFNSIIQHGNQEAYATTDFTTGPLSKTNMNDRYVSISFRNDAENNLITYVNVNSCVIEGDIEVENGYIHTIDHVLSPSDASICDQVMANEDMQFFGSLIALTGWDLKTQEFKDEAWEEKYDDIRGTDYNYTVKSWAGKYPNNRYIGYTIFAETDDVYANYGITDLASLKAWVQANNNFDDDTNTGHTTSWGDNYTNDYNWLNQFVAYHILPEKLTWNNMITEANEYGCYASMLSNRPEGAFYVNVWEYWETLGVQHRSLKITGCRVGGEKQHRINRASQYRNANYMEYNVIKEGIRITQPDKDNDALNGFFYPINDILIWNADVPNVVLNERMRYDVTALFPEMLTNNIRQNRNSEDCGSGYWFFTTDYFDNVVDMSDATIFIYLPNQGLSGSTGSWMDYQIDEFNINGIFDFTMKLPPVPYTGTYEIRYGINANNNRGMAQVYLGTNKNNLPAIGIPLDLRQSSGVQTSNTGWVSETNLTDDDLIQENVKTMRNMGFMKGPKYLYLSNGTGRTDSRCLRKIIYTGELKAGTTYYIRFKSVLSNTAEFFYDYLELVPKSVYAGEDPEDIW